MKSVKKFGEVKRTDVLIIGGGVSGLCAAIKARESQADVLVVDKGGIGWAGQVPISAGNISCPYPGREDEYFQWAVADGHYLNNQLWTYTFAHEIRHSIDELSTYGFPFILNNGQIAFVNEWEDHATTWFDAAKSMVQLKNVAVAKGAHTMDKIFMTDLLQRGSEVVGAVGFGLVDGEIYIFLAKTVVLAMGSCRYQQQKMFGVNAGEGVAMAYRAGAQLANAEFCNNYVFGMKITGAFDRPGMYMWFENARGENIMEKYYPETLAGKEHGKQKQDNWQVTNAMASEVEAGRGPIYLDMGKLTPEEKIIAKGVQFGELSERKDFQRILSMDPWRLLKEKAGIDPDNDKFEVQPMLSGGQGPIRIDLDGRTTVPGLWAAGDGASLGSGWTGARPSGMHAGFSIAFGILSGLRAGRSAGKYAMAIDQPQISTDTIERTRRRMLEPLDRSSEVNVNDVIYQVHEAIVPIKYNFHREASRLKEALDKIATAKQALKRARAENHHQLARCHQTESMAMAAEWTLKAALMREESRGTHYRDDFPDKDNNHWLKWIVIQDKNGVSQFFTEPVPFDQYRLKPEKDKVPLAKPI